MMVNIIAKFFPLLFDWKKNKTNKLRKDNNNKE